MFVRRNKQPAEEPRYLGWLRGLLFAAGAAALWQLLYISGIFNKLIFPSVGQILSSLWQELLDGSLLLRTGYSLRLILIGMGIAAAAALLLALLSMLCSPCKQLCRALIAVLDPLPGIALLPVALLLFDIGEDAIIFVMLHSILWPMLLNILSGFDSVPAIYDEVGRSIGLGRLGLLCGVYVPAALPSILTGFKTGWSRAWRALISAEMVFGATGSKGGLGWDIFTKKAYFDMPGMFATLLVIMLIGIIVEKALFANIERLTIRKWGMSA